MIPQLLAIFSPSSDEAVALPRFDSLSIGEISQLQALPNLCRVQVSLCATRLQRGLHRVLGLPYYVARISLESLPPSYTYILFSLSLPFDGWRRHVSSVNHQICSFHESNGRCLQVTPMSSNVFLGEAVAANAV